MHLVLHMYILKASRQPSGQRQCRKKEVYAVRRQGRSLCTQEQPETMPVHKKKPDLEQEDVFSAVTAVYGELTWPLLAGNDMQLGCKCCNGHNRFPSYVGSRHRQLQALRQSRSNKQKQCSSILHGIAHAQSNGPCLTNTSILGAGMDTSKECGP